MGRKSRGTALDAMLEIASRLPWWLGVVLALVSYVVLSWVAEQPAAVQDASPGHVHTLVVTTLAKTFAQIGQYLLPAMFLIGALTPGSPDVVLPRYRVAIFVHGCFWHRHVGCKYTTNPSTRKEFWQQKFAGNIARDQRNQAALLESGWRVLIIWECGLRMKDDLNLACQWIVKGEGPLLEWPSRR